MPIPKVALQLKALQTEMETLVASETSGAPDTIPKAEFLRRLATITAKYNGLAKYTESLEAHVTEWHPTVDAAEGIATTLEAQGKELADFRTRTPLTAAGITDPDVQDTVLARWQRIPEAQRPKLDAWLADPKGAKADRILAPHLAVKPAEGSVKPKTGDPKPAPVIGGTKTGDDKPAPVADASGIDWDEISRDPLKVNDLSNADRIKYKTEISAALAKDL